MTNTKSIAVLSSAEIELELINRAILRNDELIRQTAGAMIRLQEKQMRRVLEQRLQERRINKLKNSP